MVVNLYRNGMGFNEAVEHVFVLTKQHRRQENGKSN